MLLKFCYLWCTWHDNRLCFSHIYGIFFISVNYWLFIGNKNEKYIRHFLGEKKTFGAFLRTWLCCCFFFLLKCKMYVSIHCRSRMYRIHPWSGPLCTLLAPSPPAVFPFSFPRQHNESRVSWLQLHKPQPRDTWLCVYTFLLHAHVVQC